MINIKIKEGKGFTKFYRIWDKVIKDVEEFSADKLGVKTEHDLNTELDKEMTYGITTSKTGSHIVVRTGTLKENTRAVLNKGRGGNWKVLMKNYRPSKTFYGYILEFGRGTYNISPQSILNKNFLENNISGGYTKRAGYRYPYFFHTAQLKTKVFNKRVAQINGRIFKTLQGKGV